MPIWNGNGTGLEASVGVDVCSCGWVFVSVNNTDSCNISLSCILVHSLVPPQVGAFLPHVSSGALPPVHQVSSLLQPVCGPSSGLCVCKHVCMGVGGGDRCVCIRICVCLYICARQILVFHSPPNGLCRFPHRLVCSQPMCSGERVNLSISFLLLHSQYK